MSNKTTRIISTILLVIPSLMLIMSGIMKLAADPKIVEGLGKMGLGPYISLFGIIELASVALLLYPKTRKVGFLLLCSYLGGALSIELAVGRPPMATIFLVLLWIGMYLFDKSVFVKSPAAETK